MLPHNTNDDTTGSPTSILSCYKFVRRLWDEMNPSTTKEKNPTANGGGWYFQQEQQITKVFEEDKKKNRLWMEILKIGFSLRLCKLRLFLSYKRLLLLLLFFFLFFISRLYVLLSTVRTWWTWWTRPSRREEDEYLTPFRQYIPSIYISPTNEKKRRRKKSLRR